MKLNKEYYPTPRELALKMAAQLDRNKYVQTVLEPSAGDGNLIMAIGEHYHRSYSKDFQVDFLEIDENLCGVCKHRFDDSRQRELLKEREKYSPRYSAAEGKTIYPTEEEKKRHEEIEEQLDALKRVTARCVGEDFLTFHTYKKYDCIIMNPPFSNGTTHLLKAIDVQRRHGGMIICLLNAETIRNPYSEERKHLVRLLQEYDAELEFITEGFMQADRKTAVETVLITVDIPAMDRKSLIFDHLEKAGKMEDGSMEHFLMAGNGTIERLLEQFNYEVSATIRLIQEFEQMKPYMLSSMKYPGEQQWNMPMLELKLSGGGDVTVNEYLKKVRMKYWNALFHNKEFTSRLTSNLYDTFMGTIGSMADFDFNMHNINQVMKKLAAEMEVSYEETILNLFDKLSAVHAYNGTPDDQNVHYFNGWKTNKSWKINDTKVIIPCYGAFSNYSWRNTFDARAAYKLLSDIEKTLDYLDGGETAECSLTLHQVLQAYNDQDVVRNVPLKYFNVTFYKKGTCHIKWTNKRLVEKLNIYGSRKKAWLPPAYGSKHYDEMDSAEQAVIDAFQGKEAYEQILYEKDYYLPEETVLFPLLAG